MYITFLDQIEIFDEMKPEKNAQEQDSKEQDSLRSTV